MLAKVLFLVAFTIIGCHCDEDLNEVLKANEKYTFSLYKQLASTQQGNIVLPGLPSDLILSLLANGANGDTKSELFFGLNLVKNDQTRNNGYRQLIPALDIKNSNLNIYAASKLYPAEGLQILEPFKNLAQNEYKSEIENINYKNKDQVAGTINKWAEQQSQNKLQNLIESNQVSEQSRLVLASILGVSGLWAQPFQSTKKGQFSSSSTEAKEIDYLQSTAQTKYRVCGFYQAKFLELDLQGGNISMTIILPNDINGLKRLEDDLEGVVEPHNMKSGLASISIPKFRAESTYDLVPALKKLGVEKLFSNEADLSGITSEKNIKVDALLQKAVIEINEKGVDATGGSHLRLIRQAPVAAAPVFTFEANHPFLYYIREKSSGALLITGRYQG